VATRARSLRALLVVAATLVVLAAVGDLMRSDSFLRTAWHRLQGRPETPAERLLEGLKKTRGVPERSR
jgi:hypothetical protein